MRSYDANIPVAAFIGPSISRRDAEALLCANYFPPARLGDIYALIGVGVEIIVLVDGIFSNSPAVWQRELAVALAAGIRVIGAASMGALRATELAAHGMIGCGAIFEWYQRGTIDGDDEVALLHGDESSGYRSLSEPLVNIRATLQLACLRGILTSHQAQGLIDEMKLLAFSERSYHSLCQGPTMARLPRKSRANLEALLKEDAVNQKRIDAQEALMHAAALLSAGLRADHGLLGAHGPPSGDEVATSSRSTNIPTTRLTDGWRPSYHETSFAHSLLGRGFLVDDTIIVAKQWLQRVLVSCHPLPGMIEQLFLDFILELWIFDRSMDLPSLDFELGAATRFTTSGPSQDPVWLRENGLTLAQFRKLKQRKALRQIARNQAQQLLAIPSANWNTVQDLLDESQPLMRVSAAQACSSPPLPQALRWAEREVQKVTQSPEIQESAVETVPERPGEKKVLNQNMFEPSGISVADIFIIADWAERHGLAVPGDTAREEADTSLDMSGASLSLGPDEKVSSAPTIRAADHTLALSRWILDLGPDALGYQSWSWKIAWVEALQCTGAAAKVARAFLALPRLEGDG